MKVLEWVSAAEGKEVRGWKRERSSPLAVRLAAPCRATKRRIGGTQSQKSSPTSACNPRDDSIASTKY